MFQFGGWCERLFMEAGFPVNILLPDVDGVTPDSFWTPLNVTIFPGDVGDEVGKLQLAKMLLAAGADPQRNIWGKAF